MKLSIIIPVYNAERYLVDCINSILNQSFQDFELILVNDGSTDNSLQICKQYQELDTRIKVFDKLNGGVSTARNKGLKEAKGEWVYFVDADDYLLPDAFSYFINDVNVNSYDIIYNGMNKVDINGNIIKVFKNNSDIQFKNSSDLIKDNNLKILNIVVCFYKRSLIYENDILFNTNVKYGEDLCFSMKIFSIANGIFVSDKVIYSYLENSDSAMNKPVSISSIVDHLVLASDLISFKNNHKLSTYFIKYSINYMIKSFFSRTLNCGVNGKWKLLNSIYNDFYKSNKDYLYKNFIFYISKYDIRIYCFLMRIKQLIR